MDSQWKNVKTKIIALMILNLLFLLIASTAMATTYYIDYINGSDLNNGTSTLSPFKHAPGDSRASGNAQITLTPGNIVIFKGGVTYALIGGYLLANGDGTAGNEIIYRSGHLLSPQWGTTRAVIDGSGMVTTYRKGIVDLYGKDYITIDGLEIMYNAYVEYLGCIGGDYSTANKGHVTITNNILHGCTSGIFISGDYNATYIPPMFTMSNNEIYNNYWHGIHVRYKIDGITISGNKIYSNGPGETNPNHQGDGIFIGLDGASSSARVTNLTVYSNDVYDHPCKGNILVAGCESCVFERNYLHESVNGTRFNFSVGRGNNITIRNNLLVDSVETTTCTAVATTELEGMFRISTDGGDINNISYYNNTVIGNSGGYGFFAQWSGYSVSNITIKNNIFNLGSGGTYYTKFKDGVITGLVSDKNIYYGGSATPFYWNTINQTFNQWKMATGQDINSSVTNPLLDSDYKLQSISPAIDSGVAISSFSDDKNGIKRPYGSAWDIGAYELNKRPLAPIIPN